MKKFEIDNELKALSCKKLGLAGMFVFLGEDKLNELVELAGEVLTFEDGEKVLNAGASPDFFFVIVKGEISVVLDDRNDGMEIVRLIRGQMVGEMAMIQNEPHSYSCFARGHLAVIPFSAKVFHEQILAIPGVYIPLIPSISKKILTSQTYPVFIENRGSIPDIDGSLLKLFPEGFLKKHRILPVKKLASYLLIAHCDPVDREQLEAIDQILPEDFDIRPIYFDPEFFAGLFQKNLEGGSADRQSSAQQPAEEMVRPEDLCFIDEVLSRLVTEKGSDLYLSAGQMPRWRIDGEIVEVPGTRKSGPDEVLEMLRPLARNEVLDAFVESCDEDFAYSTSEGFRFRVNLLRDHNGISAVFRYIPGEISSLEALGLPEILTSFCTQPKGLVLVAGPTGSGKSTTMSAMIDWINRHRKCHILTIEDPIEFVHGSQKALVNQREVGVHTRSFAKALRAGLRENPDVVMVGEIRDNETMAMALETANTGHLVFATVHTATAASTIDRVVDNFPAESQNQIRMFLADSLLGVVCQTLCRKITRGCVPAFEIMIVDPAMANLIRTGKSYMLPNAMQTAQSKGNRLLNDDLCQLVKNGVISQEEAMSKTRDRAELERKLAQNSIPQPEKKLE
ncbi:MAG TPA: PilT/PilU family type 4a pilus ATPase [Candidatus Ozemobacteraceae bacterium]|nr:PilT/PilU family type 4a pilus ATPase [Candidatus Ozemobacteraceae bacterium]